MGQVPPAFSFGIIADVQPGTFLHNFLSLSLETAPCSWRYADRDDALNFSGSRLRRQFSHHRNPALVSTAVFAMQALPYFEEAVGRSCAVQALHPASEPITCPVRANPSSWVSRWFREEQAR